MSWQQRNAVSQPFGSIVNRTWAKQPDDADRAALSGVKQIFAGSEQLFPADRTLIETGFGKPLSDFYGCAEVIYFAMETPEQSGYRVSDESVIVEERYRGK